jgi:prepilin-type N-terminal cleavage/methylation domain-containing protein/prepilin-type processing-associated H-X9-DG protein
MTVPCASGARPWESFHVMFIDRARACDPPSVPLSTPSRCPRLPHLILTSPSKLMKTPFPNRRGFTLLELLVVVAIIAVLAALLVPVVGRMTERGRTTKCTNYLQQIGAAAMRYAGENEMQLPVTSHQRRTGYKSWTITLQPYASGKLFFRCPCDEDKERPYSYAMNDFLTPNPAGAPELDVARLSRLDRARETVLFAEAAKEYVNTDHFHFSDYLGRPIPPEIFTKQVAAERHGGAANYLFADAHVETIPWERAQKLLREDGSRFFDPTIEDPVPE